MDESNMIDAGTAAQEARTYTQAELDALLRQQHEAAEQATEERLEAARREGREEAERLGRMTAEERLTHEREAAEREARRRMEALDAREAELVRRELMAGAVEELRRRELPGELASLLNYEDEHAVGESIDRLDAVIRAAVQRGIEARLRQSGVKLPAGAKRADAAAMDDAAYYASLKR